MVNSVDTGRCNLLRFYSTFIRRYAARKAGDMASTQAAVGAQNARLRVTCDGAASRQELCLARGHCGAQVPSGGWLVT